MKNTFSSIPLSLSIMGNVLHFFNNLTTTFWFTELLLMGPQFTTDRWSDRKHMYSKLYEVLNEIISTKHNISGKSKCFLLSITVGQRTRW